MSFDVPVTSLDGVGPKRNAWETAATMVFVLPTEIVVCDDDGDSDWIYCAQWYALVAWTVICLAALVL